MRRSWASSRCPGPIDPNRSGQCSFDEVAARLGAALIETRDVNAPETSNAIREARARADLRRRLVAARSRPVHRARERGRLRDAPDAAAAPPRARADPVGDPHRAGANGRDALRDRRRVGGLGLDRRAGHAGYRAGRDRDDALRAHRGRARRADTRAAAAAPRAAPLRVSPRIRAARARGPGALLRTGSSTGRRGRRTSTTGCARRHARIRAPSRSSGTRR